MPPRSHVAQQLPAGSCCLQQQQKQQQFCSSRRNILRNNIAKITLLAATANTGSSNPIIQANLASEQGR